jgi:WD40 repeat protein
MDGTIRFWDLRRGVCDRVICVNRPVHSLALSPDGKTLVSGDYDSTVTLWDVATGECLRTFQGHASGHVYSVAWSANGSRIASACSDSTIRIWNVSTGDCEHVIQGKNHGLSVDWHPVNDLLAIGFLEQPIQLWDGQTGKTVKTLRNKLPYEGTNIAGVTGISKELSSVEVGVLRCLVTLQPSLNPPLKNEGISAQLIAEMIDEDEYDVEAVLENWIEFLVQEQIDGETRYSLYHSSFRDWLGQQLIRNPD